VGLKRQILGKTDRPGGRKSRRGVSKGYGCALELNLLKVSSEGLRENTSSQTGEIYLNRKSGKFRSGSSSVKSGKNPDGGKSYGICKATRGRVFHPIPGPN